MCSQIHLESLLHHSEGLKCLKKFFLELFCCYQKINNPFLFQNTINCFLFVFSAFSILICLFPTYFHGHQFISERIEIAKYDSDAQVAMFACMFHRTLHMTVGNPDAKISRHIGAVGTRFRLLSCALTLIQGK